MKLLTENFHAPVPLAAALISQPGSHIESRGRLEQSESSALAFALKHLIDDLPDQVALLDEN